MTTKFLPLITRLIFRCFAIPTYSTKRKRNGKSTFYIDAIARLFSEKLANKSLCQCVLQSARSYFSNPRPKAEDKQVGKEILRTKLKRPSSSKIRPFLISYDLRINPVKYLPSVAKLCLPGNFTCQRWKKRSQIFD